MGGRQQARTSGIMRFSQPHDRGGGPWRVARPHCCGRAPSEPCVRVVPAHGSSKPREDPLPQTLYVALDLRPVNRPPLQGFALGSVRPRRSRGVQRVPWFPRRCHRALHRLTRPRGRPFGPGHQAPYPASAPGATARRSGREASGSCRLSAHRHSLLGSSCARWGCAPSLRSAYRARLGPHRGCHVARA